MIAIMVPPGFAERAGPAPVKAGGRGGPLGLGAGAGEGGLAGTAGRDDATGGAGAEGDGGDATVELEAPDAPPPGIGTALDGTRGPDGIAGAGGPVLCRGTTLVGEVFNGATG